MLYGQGVRLRAIEREDIAAFVRWFNDPEVRQYMLVYAPMSTAQEERWFQGTLDAKDDYYFGIEALVDGKWVHIGNVGLHAVDWKNRVTTFAIIIGEKQYWGRGYGTEATRIILSFAFHELNLHRVELEVFDFNPRAMRAYEKAGFRREGTRRQALYHDGRYHDVHTMSVLREEFDTAPPQAGGSR